LTSLSARVLSAVIPGNPRQTGLRLAVRSSFPVPRQSISEIADSTRSALGIGRPDTDPVHELLDAEHEYDRNE
jgi:hypothetical protein